MKAVLFICLSALASCTSSSNGAAVCDATLPLAAKHAANLANDPNDASVLSGQALIATLDAACH